MWRKLQLLGSLLLAVTTCHSEGDRTLHSNHKVPNDVTDETNACQVGEVCSEGAPILRLSTRARPATDSRRFLDFVFIVECPCSENGSQLGLITESLKTWLHLSLTHPPHSRLALILFSPHSVTTTDVKDFTPLHSSLTTSLPALCDNVCTPPNNESHGTSINYGGYFSMERTLQLVSDVLDGREVLTSFSSTKRLYLRPHADAHIISFTGFLATSQSSSKEQMSSYKQKLEDLVSSLIEATHFSHTALHFFVNATSNAASLIGSAKHAVRYRDCTHFNKAQTLSKMIMAGEQTANSLQAHLLAKGVKVEVSDVHDLLSRDCLRNLNPSLWSQFDIHTPFEDKCVKRMPCPSGMVCYPLHGCVKENMVLNSLAFGEDRAPLPTDLSTSHADIASSSSSSPPGGQLVKEPLSIIENPSSTSPFSLADIITGSPDVLLWSPEKPFVADVIKNGVPVVIKNSVVSSWPARKKWSLSHIAEHIGMDMLPLVKCTNTSLTFDPDKRVPLKLNLTLPYTVSNMSREDFFTCVQEEGSCSKDGYSGHYYFGTVPEALGADLQPNVLLYNTEKDYAAKKQFIWISSSGMITHGHFDQDFNFFVQLVGEKKFTLWSSSQHEMMYVFPRIHPLWHKSRVNFRAPDLSQFPQFAHTRALQVTVGPGDVLFIPPYTWHYVETLTPSVSLSTWSHDYQLYDHMSAIYRHDHKFDLIGDTRGELVYNHLVFYLRLRVYPFRSDVCSEAVSGHVGT